MYDKQPYVPVSSDAGDCHVGWDAIRKNLRRLTSGERCIVCVECYPGVSVWEIKQELEAALDPQLVIDTESLFLPPDEINQRVSPFLTDDPVFGTFNSVEVRDFFDPIKVSEAQNKLESLFDGIALVIGTGAVEVANDYCVIVYADLARWEIQRRQRAGEIGNLGANNIDESPAQKYKRAYFLDWRAADRIKQKLLGTIDLLLDTNDPTTPKMITGDQLRAGLYKSARQPFRVVPFFDPGPWGGHWMEREFDLPKDVPNYAWCFDCVPEENSLLLGFGSVRVEIPAINVVFAHPTELLGSYIFGRFGAEFPIRFDFLDTIEGGNLSLQVHPLNEYVRKHFGLAYTQDESYYMLDAEPNATVYLGLKEDINPPAMLQDLQAAQEGGPEFDADRYVNKFPACKHDHFLIPAGTVHCSGVGSMVLEISATPYIFTLKLWDWGRLGLDGQPRPINIARGEENIQWDRKTAWVKENLVNRIEAVAQGEGWREERTGLHELEFIETRRHWFTGPVPHDTNENVNVLNLVQGEEAIVESLVGSFTPFVVHYAETFIVPAAVGSYQIRPHGPSVGKQCATLKAYVRPE
ncbi:MAG TPA: class I mannose-6-phosphate isomerase [Edaphobacter sp.]|nr:class I mannose-6-phosphate isomerase [Edaphobacter sp.]